MNVETKMQAFLLKGARERLENSLDDMESIVRGDYDCVEDTLVNWCESMETLFVESLKDYFSTALFNHLQKCEYPSECHTFIMGRVYREMSRAVTLHCMDEELSKAVAVMEKVAGEVINGKEEYP